jgi:hypothetical protein
MQWINLNATNASYSVAVNTSDPTKQTYRLEFSAASNIGLLQNVTFTLTLTTNALPFIFENQFSFTAPAGSLQVLFLLSFTYWKEFFLYKPFL